MKLPKPGPLANGYPPEDFPRVESIPSAALPTFAFAMTGKLSNIFPRWINENIEGDWGVTGPGLLLIGLLSRAGNMTMTQIATHLDVTPGGVTRIVKSLEEMGLVERVENPQDRRQAIVQLTASAKKKAKRLLPIHDALVAKAFSELSKEELRAYISVSIKLAKSLRTRAPKD